MNQSVSEKGHPTGLWILFGTEMWERFNYYGMRAVLVLFITKVLLFDKAFASNLYGSYTSLVYLTPLVGGFVADRFWGNQRSIIAGGILMALGEFLLFFCGATYQSAPGVSNLLFFSGLGFMIAGNGFFKPNISSLVGQLYPKGDRRIDPAYTIFYMGINVGGAIGPFICGLVGDTGDPNDFKWAFLAGGIAMVLSIVVQLMFHHKYVVGPDNKTLGLTPAGSPAIWTKPIAMILGLAAFSALAIGMLYVDAKVVPYLPYLLTVASIFIFFMILSDKTLSKKEKDRVLVIFILVFFVIFFWSAFEQAGASLTFFADEQTQRQVNLRIPLWLVYTICTVLFAFTIFLFRKVAKNLAGEFHQRLRNTVFFLLVLFAAAILYAVYQVYSLNLTVIDFKEVPASWFQSLNSIFVVAFAPVFAWLWLKLGKWEPSSPTKMAIGLLLLAIGYWWIATGVHNIPNGVKVSMIWLTGMYALHTWGELCLSPIGLSLVNKLAPFKYASLLMAVWFLGNAFANKLAGVLSALYPDGKTTSLLGYQMKDNYDFFLLFLVMAGLASLILFVLTKKLQKMMHTEEFIKT